MSLFWLYAFWIADVGWAVFATTLLILSYRYRRGLFAPRCHCDDL